GDGEGGRALAGGADQRQVEQVVRTDARGIDRIELALVAGAETAEVERVAGIVSREQEAGQVLVDHQVAARRARQAVAQGDTIVVGAHYHAEHVAVRTGQVDLQLAVVVAAFARLAGDPFVALVRPGAAAGDHAQRLADLHVAGQAHAKRRGRDHRPAVARQGPGGRAFVI